ncbi:MAG: hypothetical protein ABR610_14875 [Thermoanaerobaculia bacterium]
MMKRISQLALAGILCLAPFAAAQNADQNTAGPSKNQLKLRLTEPQEGAQISGSSIRVAVDYNKTSFGEGQGTKFGDKNFPMAIFDVYVDNTLKQTLKGGDANVAVINDVPFGKHKIVVMAKNISNEVIDRAEVNVTNTEVAAATTTTDTTATTVAPPDANRGASASSNTTDATAPSSSRMPSRSYDTSPSSTTDTNRTSSMPRTASHAPEAALLGLALVAGGLLVARRAR